VFDMSEQDSTTSGRLLNDEERSGECSFLQSGTILNGRYQIIKPIASGSMGVIYLVRHLLIGGKRVVLKLIAPKIASDNILVARFQDELRTTFRINHPNVIRTYECVKFDSRIGYTMEYAGGGDLAGLIESETDLLYPVIIEILLQICYGVKAIHENGIVHRDLKPENVLLGEDGTIKIADFGIALTRGYKRLTKDGEILGVIDYIAPEYLEYGHVDKRCDIYAVGMLAYKLICKRLPVEGLSYMESIRHRVKHRLPGPRTFRDDCPRQLNDFVLKAIERKPKKRYQCIEDMIEILRAIKRENCQTQIREKTDSIPTRRVFCGALLGILITLILVPSMQSANENVVRTPSLESFEVIEGKKISLPKDDAEGAEYAFFSPRVKGPRTDVKNPDSITSRTAWSTPEGMKCSEIESAVRLGVKARAVREILRRYTGSNDYYDALNSKICSPYCEENKAKSILSGIEIVNLRGGAFRIEDDDGSCRYKLTRREDRHWSIYRAKKVVCHCLIATVL